MNIEEANELVSKCMKVILSCKTYSQLNNAVKFADFTYKILANGIGLINESRFVPRIERSIGFAQCNIENQNKLTN